MSMNFMKNTEDLIRIDGAESQIIVGIAAVIEVKSSHHLVMQEPSHNLLNILRLVVMASIDQNQRLRASCAREEQCHAPVSHIGVVEGRFKGFVFDQQTLFGVQAAVDFLERLFEPDNSLADALCSRIV